MQLNNAGFEKLGISQESIRRVLHAEAALTDVFAQIDATEAIAFNHVLRAFQEEGVAARHFAPTSGYGYDDIGRDTLDRVFAKALGAEDAYVRPQFVNGTHALYLALASALEPGDVMLAITGKPYDTLEDAIGIGKDAPHSLKRMGAQYRMVELTEAGEIDIPAVLTALNDPAVKVVYAQRSRGYAWRKALTINDLKNAFAAIRNKRTDVCIIVDNCYGEFTNELEPCAVGADLIAGSLIKNPGGGLAPTGGYIAGTHECVERAAHTMTVPGLGREVGSYAGSYTPFYQGLFMAPHCTAQSLKSAALFARVFEELGMETMPGSSEARSDIIQSVKFKDKQSLITFCQRIQKAAPIDSFVTPEPWDMPGYSHQVIMAAGAFVQGASIELSADAPIREPYIAYVQGALTYAHGRIGAMMALDGLLQA
ncbi:MAG: methionine gamma-lyase family protein [Eubacteriales bacterium]|nr:methionine gamma-lyase family protein [Eubacteriales bacterium]